MKGTIKRRCYCKDEAGKELGARCPELPKAKHGAWEFRDRLVRSEGKPSFRRAGFRTKTEAEGFRDRVYELLALAKGDGQSAIRVADLIWAATRHGGDLPSVDDVRRRLGLGGPLDRSQTVADWLVQWMAGKRALRNSAARGYRQHLDHYLVPLLGKIQLDRLSPDHIDDMFDQIDTWNREIALAKTEGRRPVLVGDVRTRSGIVGVATQRRIFATLRNALNVAMTSRPRRIDYNPCDSVEMPAEYRDPALTWSPAQVARFLDHCEETQDRLTVLYRLVLLCGLRRGEAVGARRARFDHRKRELWIARPLIQLGGHVEESRPKTRSGERLVVLDQGTADLVKVECRERLKEKLAFGVSAYEDDDLMFCWEDGTRYSPDYISRKFRETSAAAGLPRIKLHEGRHTAASLALEAGIDIKVVSERLGHSNTTITQNLYQHVRRVLHDQAADAVVNLLPVKPKNDRTGS